MSSPSSVACRSNSVAVARAATASQRYASSIASRAAESCSVSIAIRFTGHPFRFTAMIDANAAVVRTFRG